MICHCPSLEKSLLMFPASGLFAHVNCQLSERGLCERPYCLYRHARDVQDMYDTMDKSLLDLTVVEAATDEATDECFQQLERINREIESVKHQVEQEQRRLSHYQHKPATRISDPSCSKYEVITKNARAILSETFSRPKKYILDSSKPRTDLEYDPLSNFSSDLRSYSSSNKEHKIKNGNGLIQEHCKLNQKKPHAHHMSQKHSPGHSDSEDDDILIIDIPPSPSKSKEIIQPVTDGEIVNSISHSATNVRDDVGNDLEATNPISTHNTCNDVIMSEDDNIFVKMTRHFSSYNNINAEQPCALQNNLFVKNPNIYASPVSKQQHGNIQISENPDQNIECDSKSKETALLLQHNVPSCFSEKSSKIPQQKPQAEMVFVGSLCKPQDILAAANLTHTAQMQSPTSDQKKPKNKDFIVIDSSSECELNYSDLELSESDPDEECYRIFMEANGEDEQPEPSKEFVEDTELEKLNVELKPQVLSGKKRIAHEANLEEQPVHKRRPQPQVLVPLQEPVTSRFSSQSATSVVRKVEQRASMLTASVKAGQAFISKGQSETQHAQAAPALNPVPYLNYIPLGATVIDVGNNLHLVLPEGMYPVSDSSGRLTSVLTPITHVNPNPIIIKQTCHQAAPTQVRRTSQPVIIPPLARKPTSAAAAASTNQCTSSQASLFKPTASKRKMKMQCEPVKVPHDVRQNYVNKFTEEFLKTTTNVQKAFEKAVAEEKTVYNRSANKLKYLSIAVNALKRLKSQSSGAVNDKHQINQKTKGNIPLNSSLLKDKGTLQLYKCLKDYVLTEEKLIESNFPLQHPERTGSAVLFADKKSTSDPLRKLCCRCGATYSVSQTGKHTRKEECTYHYGKGVENKVPGGVETRYSCCEGVMGSPGCQVFKLHVCNSLSMDGFVSTAPGCSSDTDHPGVYSLDCEMCYTVHGLELSRVTVVNSSLQIVYDTFVRPSNEVIDYNTRFSGISEEDMKGHCHSLREVQKTLLSFITADTILIGHCLETDLCVLKLLHGMVVDTSVVFPHRLGPPHKLCLNSLTAEFLRKIIQDSVCGHDTAEDAAACMELMLWKAKEDGKLKKLH